MNAELFTALLLAIQDRWPCSIDRVICVEIRWWLFPKSVVPTHVEFTAWVYQGRI